MNEPRAIKRAREHYNVDLSMDDLQALEQSIIDGNAVRVDTDVKTGCYIYLVQHESTVMRCVVLPEYDRILTFFPIDHHVNKQQYERPNFQHKRRYYSRTHKRRARKK